MKRIRFKLQGRRSNASKTGKRSKRMMRKYKTNNMYRSAFKRRTI